MKSKSILFFLFFLFAFTGCKYEDGPGISFRTACDRVKGEWEIESLHVDGADSLADFQTKQIYCLTYNFDIDRSNFDLIGSDCIGGAPGTNKLGGSWSLNHDNTKIAFGLESSFAHAYGPIFQGPNRWTIIRLSNKEMWLKILFFNNKTYEIRFKAK